MGDFEFTLLYFNGRLSSSFTALKSPSLVPQPTKGKLDIAVISDHEETLKIKKESKDALTQCSCRKLIYSGEKNNLRSDSPEPISTIDLCVSNRFSTRNLNTISVK